MWYTTVVNRSLEPDWSAHSPCTHRTQLISVRGFLRTTPCRWLFYVAALSDKIINKRIKKDTAREANWISASREVRQVVQRILRACKWTVYCRADDTNWVRKWKVHDRFPILRGSWPENARISCSESHARSGSRTRKYGSICIVSLIRNWWFWSSNSAERRSVVCTHRFATNELDQYSRLKETCMVHHTHTLETQPWWRQLVVRSVSKSWVCLKPGPGPDHSGPPTKVFKTWAITKWFAPTF